MQKSERLEGEQTSVCTILRTQADPRLRVVVCVLVHTNATEDAPSLLHPTLFPTHPKTLSL